MLGKEERTRCLAAARRSADERELAIRKVERDVLELEDRFGAFRIAEGGVLDDESGILSAMSRCCMQFHLLLAEERGNACDRDLDLKQSYPPIRDLIERTPNPVECRKGER